MGITIALVGAYLHLNGYFTVTDFPVAEALGEGAYGTATHLLTLENVRRGTPIPLPRQ